MKKHIPFALRLIVALILIQTLRFKLTAHPDSVYIFEQVGLEPLGRIGIGIVELIAGNSDFITHSSHRLAWCINYTWGNWRRYNDASYAIRH